MADIELKGPRETQSENFLLHMTPTLRERVRVASGDYAISQTSLILQLVEGGLNQLDRKKAASADTAEDGRESTQ